MYVFIVLILRKGVTLPLHPLAIVHATQSVHMPQSKFPKVCLCAKSQ